MAAKLRCDLCGRPVSVLDSYRRCSRCVENMVPTAGQLRIGTGARELRVADHRRNVRRSA